MPLLWLHHNPGFWYLTHDGLTLVRKVQRITLCGVRFLIDPEGQRRARAASKRVTHAWAVGTEHAAIRAPGQPCSYSASGSGEFEAYDGALWLTLLGAAYATFWCDAQGDAKASVIGPLRGRAERRRVQQYGGHV